METINFLELARERYSCRQLSDRKVEAEKLNRILEAARIAPTAHNEQPFRLFLLESPEAVEKAKEITPCTFGAACFLVVGAVAKEAWVREFDQKNFAEIDAGIVATQIMLAIEAEGLGTTWVGYFDAPRAKELFPEMAECELIALFPIGYRAESARPAYLHEQRRPMSELLERL
ncbi:MAG: nitroreductase family protein [Stomatobaculum longum]